MVDERVGEMVCGWCVIGLVARFRRLRRLESEIV